jgi:hypothetical protein
VASEAAMVEVSMLPLRSGEAIGSVPYIWQNPAGIYAAERIWLPESIRAHPSGGAPDVQSVGRLQNP